MTKILQNFYWKKGRMLKMTETMKMPLTNGNCFCIMETSNEKEQYLNPTGSERTRMVRVSAKNSANLTLELRTENQWLVGSGGFLR